jgi:hypothetical protein
MQPSFSARLPQRYVQAGDPGCPPPPFPYGATAIRLDARARELMARSPGMTYIPALKLAALQTSGKRGGKVPVDLPEPIEEGAAPAAGPAPAPAPALARGAAVALPAQQPKQQPAAPTSRRLSRPAMANPAAANDLLVRVSTVSAGRAGSDEAAAAFERLQRLAVDAQAAGLSADELRRVGRAVDAKRVEVHETLRDRGVRFDLALMGRSYALLDRIGRLMG